MEYKTTGWNLSEDRRSIAFTDGFKAGRFKLKGTRNLNFYPIEQINVQRQRKDFAVKLARCVVKSNDFVALEDLQIRNMVKHRHLAKSISDAAWGEFRRWIEHFGNVYGVATVAVAPHYTSQNCSNCGEIVKKSLSTRTHLCLHCGHVQDRDHNAAINILRKGLSTVGHTGIKAWGEHDLCLNQETGLGKLA